MKTKFILCVLSSVLILSLKNVTAQCICGALSDISTTLTGDWEKTFDIGADDEIWDIEPIADPYGVKDDGYVVVGTANLGATGKDIVIMRLNPNGSPYTSGAWGPNGWIIVDGQADEDAAYAVEETNDGATNYLIVSGMKTTDKFTNGAKEPNAWVGKLNLDGTWAAGWNGGKEYGSTGKDVGYDIKQDRYGYYVVAGTASAANNDVPSDCHTDGDYWIFKVNNTGYLNPSYSKVFYGSAALGGNDYAQSMVLDCNTGYYVISGFCKSCDPQNNDNSQNLLVKIKPDFSSWNTQSYGNINASFKFDYGSFNIIQPHDGTFSYCSGSNSDGFLSLGIQHPQFGGCWGGTHDYWALKTLNSISTVDPYFNYQCINANAGGSYGGRKNDKGFSSVPACGGYLLAGISQSNKQAQPGCSTCEVYCNHYNCYDTPTEDIWLAKIDATTNELLWEESIGKTGNDGAHSIKRTFDGSFVIAGYTTNNNEKDFYVAKFELTEACAAPTGLAVLSVGTYCAQVRWNNEPCVWKYKVESQEDAGPWITVADPAPNPSYITDNTSGGSGNLLWRVTAYCSPNKYATTTAGATFHVSYCNGCTCPSRLAGDDLKYSNDQFTVSPNPSDGTFQISLHTADTSPAPITIAILDQAGKTMSSSVSTVDDGLLNQQLSVPNIPSGFYWIRATVAGKSYTAKLIVQVP